MAGGWAGGGGAWMPHSLLPPCLPHPLRAFVVPSIFSPGSSSSTTRVWSKGRELAHQWDPTRTPLMLRVERGEVGRAVGQLAGASTAGLGKGVPTSLRSSGPAFSLGNRDPQS